MILVTCHTVAEIINQLNIQYYSAADLVYHDLAAVNGSLSYLGI